VFFQCQVAQTTIILLADHVIRKICPFTPKNNVWHCTKIKCNTVQEQLSTTNALAQHNNKLSIIKMERPLQQIKHCTLLTAAKLHAFVLSPWHILSPIILCSIHAMWHVLKTGTRSQSMYRGNEILQVACSNSVFISYGFWDSGGLYLQVKHNKGSRLFMVTDYTSTDRHITTVQPFSSNYSWK